MRAVIVQFLPRAGHPHPLIGVDEDLHRQAILRNRAHFLDVHLERGFARDADDQAVGMRDLRADRGGKAIAHGAQAATGEPAVGGRSEEHTSELQSLMRISYAVFCLKKKTNTYKPNNKAHTTK